VSASWYPEGENVPTWNHVTAHLYGVPEILSDEENFAVLSSLTDHFEGGFEHGRSLALDEEKSRRVAKGTVGLRMRVTRFDARAKLSQNKAPEVQERIITELDARNPDLAAEMRRVRQ
jgi:transcriptional regulator